MIDSTNPRIMADNIRHLSGEAGSQASDISTLQASVEALGSYSGDEYDTGKKDSLGNIIYGRYLTGDLPEVVADGTYANTNAAKIENISIESLRGICSPSGFDGNFPYITDTGRFAKIYYRRSDSYVVVSANGLFFNGGKYKVWIEYTKSAAPSSLTSPAPDDTRSIEPEDRDSEPEAEPIEEPVVEVKKTTRKKTTTE